MSAATASDLSVQAQTTGLLAKDTAVTIAGDLRGMMSIEQGPVFLRFLGFTTSLASFGCVLFLLVNPTNLAMNPVMYVLYVYIACFALSTTLFEAKKEWIESVGPLAKYQEMLATHCSFMTLMGGRGLFYIFQGTLWLTFADSFGELVQIACAVALVFVGFLHLGAPLGLCHMR
ncbi:unnamed protein product [Polarella glacialis]|uniref:Uncharacterized protein n=1 Tax=Polarella glacialis TaxID=89957 RepID=A0A813KH44_POLGL|nr:unnamed protein product [Polarella glacialis]CAE8704702.1 unnamed protein product [Polarella glacialis]